MHFITPMLTLTALCVVTLLPAPAESIPLRKPFGPPQGECGYQTVRMLTKYEGEEVAGGYYVTAVKHYDAVQREAYRISIEDGLFIDAHGLPVDWKRSEFTDEYGAALLALFVMDACGRIYLTYHHEVGIVQHSSFLSGMPIASGGEALIVEGRLLLLNNSSGHYRPRTVIASQVLHRLKAMGADLSLADIDMASAFD